MTSPHPSLLYTTRSTGVRDKTVGQGGDLVLNDDYLLASAYRSFDVWKQLGFPYDVASLVMCAESVWLEPEQLSWVVPYACCPA